MPGRVPLLRLTALSGPEPRAVYELGEGTYSLGRSPDNSIVLRDESVSRCHALLVCRQGRCRVEDLGSANGAFHNDLRVANSPLGGGDRLADGDLEFQVDYRSASWLRTLAVWVRDALTRRALRVRRPRPMSRAMLDAIGQATRVLSGD